ncbi:hypothetical protein L249_8201 [Ophiocordyceps polyrhachis-furcata BCC 54312]|uniref:Uncharacterized protein n=1 Tax=Ophiocordyceps polyrhachis-furcata BCC 54312 TaxID=1330021 RepID=A0A367LHI1_9HYPO|nr:hypothetical protein L249_8201 [Ophiocordyceps polyrhachis-furcata BCC 54312]
MFPDAGPSFFPEARGRNERCVCGPGRTRRLVAVNHPPILRAAVIHPSTHPPIVNNNNNNTHSTLNTQRQTRYNQVSKNKTPMSRFPLAPHPPSIRRQPPQLPAIGQTDLVQTTIFRRDINEIMLILLLLTLTIIFPPATLCEENKQPTKGFNQILKPEPHEALIAGSSYTIVWDATPVYAAGSPVYGLVLRWNQDPTIFQYSNPFHIICPGTKTTTSSSSFSSTFSSTPSDSVLAFVMSTTASAAAVHPHQTAASPPQNLPLSLHLLLLIVLLVFG